MPELISLSLRHTFREFCVSHLVVRDINEIFMGFGVEPTELTEDELQMLSGARRSLVESYYKSLNWTNIKDTEVFLKVISHILELEYPYKPEVVEAQDKIKSLCIKGGFIVNNNMVTFPQQGGVKGNVKNLIFASTGPKPEIILRDSTNNDIQIVKNGQYCLVYDQPIPERGLLWQDLVEWWGSQAENSALDEKALKSSLYQRLLSSLASPPERLLFRTYMVEVSKHWREKHFALIPQVYLHYDPYTIAQHAKAGEEKALTRQRMDFLLLFSNRHRVVIEVDGQQHYSEDGTPTPRLYAEMVAEDRRLKLIGYEIYRFGGSELMGAGASKVVLSFFSELLHKYG